MQSAKRTGPPRHQQHSSLTRGSNNGHGPHSIRVLLIDDQTIFRTLFRTWLTSYPDIEVVGETDNLRDAVHLADTLQPTIGLTEIFFSGISGIEGIRKMKSLYPGIKIIALTAHLSETSVKATLQAGASGILEKNAALEDVRSALDYVIRGKTYLCPLAAEIVARRCTHIGKGPLELLTQREHEALRCIAGGMRNKDIALHLCISINTVEKHRTNLMDKLNLRKVASLTAFAIEQGITAISAMPNGSATGAVKAVRANGWNRAVPPTPHQKKETLIKGVKQK